MKTALTKYKKTQKENPRKVTSKAKSEEGYDDKLILSQEAIDMLANQNDEDPVVETINDGVTEMDDDSDDVDEVTIDKIFEKTPNKTRNFSNPDRSVNGNREQIILEYAPLIKYIAQKIAARLPANIELDDLISSGVIGLMDAIEKYDPSRDNKFKTYAEFRIRGAILDELRAQDWVPRSVREKAKMLERAYAKIEQDRGRPATDEEVCEELKISQEEYHELLNQVRSVSLLSYDDLSSVSKGDRRSMMGLAEGSRSSNPFSEVNSANLKKVIAGAIKDLPEKQRLVLSLYYYEDLNLKEIGKVLDVTESRVSQLHTQAVLRLRAKLKSHFDDFMLIFG